MLTHLTQSLVADHDRERGKGLKESSELMEAERKQAERGVDPPRAGAGGFHRKASGGGAAVRAGSARARGSARAGDPARPRAAQARAGRPASGRGASSLERDLLERRRTLEAERDKRRLELRRVAGHQDRGPPRRGRLPAEAEDAPRPTSTGSTPRSSGRRRRRGRRAATRSTRRSGRCRRSWRRCGRSGRPGTKSPRLLQLEVQLNSLRDQLSPGARAAQQDRGEAAATGA